MTMERITKRLHLVCGVSPRDCTELITEGPLGGAAWKTASKAKNSAKCTPSLSPSLYCLFPMFDIWERIMKLFPCAVRTHTASSGRRGSTDLDKPRGSSVRHAPLFFRSTWPRNSDPLWRRDFPAVVKSNPLLISLIEIVFNTFELDRQYPTRKMGDNYIYLCV